ncbi:MAG: gamma carbonic anhydrase family protein [Deltaproteobacteria bacterium]|nr:gamma carbonic anhydrase family protein [Deltaproteobacteria bacterium]
MLQSFRDIFPTVDSSAFVHERSFLAGDVVVGPESSIWPGASIRGDVGPIRIGARTNIQDNAVVHVTGGRSPTLIGDRVTVGHLALLHGCQVGDDCLIGMGSILLDDAKISPWSYVAAGSLVTPGKVFPEGVMIMGRPARVVRELTELDRQEIVQGALNYLELLPAYALPGTSSAR